jgi:hypothetical protein
MKANAEYDLVGTKEFDEFRQELLARYDVMNQSNERGVKLMRFPTINVLAAASGPLDIPAPSSGYGVIGPESGFVWRIGRITVSSSGTDTAGFARTATNPVPSQPAVPASGVAQQNTNLYPVNVVISGGTLTAVVVNGVTVGTGDGTYTVPSAGAISITYSVAPTWVWSNANGAAGFTSAAVAGAGVAYYTTSDETAQQRNLIDSSQQVGVAFMPGSRGVFLMPDEGLMAVVQATAGNIYTLTGQVFSVPAEMMGKLS